MNNKYQEFISAMDMLKKENNKNFCEQLIFQAQEYYEHYRKKRALAYINSEICNRYEIEHKDGKAHIKPREYQLGIKTQLIIWFYHRILCVYWNHRIKFTSTNLWKCIKAPDSAMRGLPESYGLYSYKIDEKIVADIIKTACKRVLNTGLSTRALLKQCSNEDINIIREVVNTYTNYDSIQFTSEESFNAMFSEEYIQELIDLMKYNEDLLFLKIAPVLQQLTEKNDGGSEIDNATWAYCYNREGKKRKYKENLAKLKKEIHDYEEYLKQYDGIFKTFDLGYKHFVNILKEFDVV